MIAFNNVENLPQPNGSAGLQNLWWVGMKQVKIKSTPNFMEYFFLISVKWRLEKENLRHAFTCVCVCVCVCLWSPSYRTGSSSQYVADPLVHEPLRMLQATKPLHKSAVCICVCVFVPSIPVCVQICARFIISSSSSTPLSEVHTNSFFCHALCTVSLHIFIYYCVFQDQNEWQIDSSEINIAAEVGVSLGRETGGMPERRSFRSR